MVGNFSSSLAATTVPWILNRHLQSCLLLCSPIVSWHAMQRTLLIWLFDSVIYLPHITPARSTYKIFIKAWFYYFVCWMRTFWTCIHKSFCHNDFFIWFHRLLHQSHRLLSYTPWFSSYIFQDDISSPIPRYTSVIFVESIIFVETPSTTWFVIPILEVLIIICLIAS